MNRFESLNSTTDMQLEKATKFHELMSQRRSIRHFLKKDIPIKLIEECVKTAGTAPSGANRQPWFFAIVRDKTIKKEIRKAAEQEEFLFYNKRADVRFLDDLKPFNLSWHKPHLEQASSLIIIFSKTFEHSEPLNKRCYYAKESVGIATGILITALHKLGVSTLTHTPSPMSFLSKILDRPKGEKPFLILATGYKDNSCPPKSIDRKTLDKICKVY